MTVDDIRSQLQHILDVYDMRSELFTSDAECAASLYDRTREVLKALGNEATAPETPEQQPMPFKDWVADIRTQSMQKTMQAYKAKIQQLEYQLACRPSEKANVGKMVVKEREGKL